MLNNTASCTAIAAAIKAEKFFNWTLIYTKLGFFSDQ